MAVFYRRMWKFDENSFTGRPEFSKDCLSVTSRRFDVESVVGTQDFLSGKHSWAIRIKKFGRGLAIGVTLKKEHLRKLGWKNGNKWVWTSGGTKYSPQLMVSASPLGWWEEGDVIKCELDCDDQKLTLKNSRTEKSDTLSGFEDPVQPYFDLFLDVNIELIEIDGEKVTR